MTAKTVRIHQRTHVLGAALALVFLVFGGQSAEAAEHTGGNPFLNKPFNLAVGGFFPSVDSEIRFDPRSSGRGTTIDVEKVLGLDDHQATFWVEGRWRFSEHQQIEAEWVALNQDGVRSASESVTIGDTTANIGARLDSEFDVDIGRVTYGWSFIKDEKKEAVLLAGAHIVHGEISIQLSGDIEDASTGASLIGTSRQEGESITFPLPHIGARFGYAVTPKLWVDVSALLFYLEIDDYKGSLVDLGATAQYLVWENVTLGAGVRYFDFSLEEDQTNGSDEVDFNYIGPVVFAGVVF